MININIALIVAAFVLALGAIYVLYAIIMHQGTKNSKGNELQLSTKNILEQVYSVQSGHPGGALSCIDILNVLYTKCMKHFPEGEKNPDYVIPTTAPTPAPTTATTAPTSRA